MRCYIIRNIKSIKRAINGKKKAYSELAAFLDALRNWDTQNNPI